MKSKVPLTTAQQLGSLIKSARDIMRKDKGLNGDLDRLPMLTWIMFLKFLDDLEQIRETDAKLAGKRFRHTIEPPYRWRDWAAKPDGITGDELIAFVNNEEARGPDGKKGPGLFAYLRSLQGTNGGDRRDVVATVFKGTVNRMINGYLLRDVVNKVHDIHFTSSGEIHTLGHLYESMLKEMRDAAGDSGEFYTPRAVVRFMVAVTNPRLGETLLDPACGTGGFLVEAFEHLRKQCKRAEHHGVLQSESLLGGEAKPLPYLLAQMNLLLHGLETPKIDALNSLRFPLKEIGDKDRVDIILTNPPFGGEEERGILSNFPEDKQASETALLFLQLIMRKLRRPPKPGRAAVIVPDGTLSELGVAAAIRKDLLSQFNLTTVIQLPPGAFAPYAETARTNILFFDSSRPSSDIWYYQIPPPNGRKQCSKSNPLTEADFDPIRLWWDHRKSTENAWLVKKIDLDPFSLNLLSRNPNGICASEELDLPKRINAIIKSVRVLLCDLQRLETDTRFSEPATRMLSELLSRNQRIIALEDDRAYKQITVQYHHRGVRLRSAQKGAEIGTKRQFLVKAGDLVLSRIDARYGAIGFVPHELDGAVITGDFWAFDVNKAEITSDYLDLFLSLPEFAKLCERASRGTTRRQRLNYEMFAGITIPWIPIRQQSVLVEKVLAANRVVSSLGELAGQARPIVMEFVRQTFGFGWIEDNVQRMHESTIQDPSAED